MFRSMFRVPLTFAVVLLAAACSDDTPTSPTPPTPITENFSGTVHRNGAVTHQFATALSGQITATLTSVTPDSTVRLNLGIGIFSVTTGACNVTVSKPDAVQGNQLVGNITTVGGTFCIRVTDPAGSINDPVSYEVQVVHPQ